MSENGVVGKVVDRYLAALYPNYFESTRAPLLTQARDLLMHTFHGDLLRFEKEFLSPAAELIENIKHRFCSLSVSFFHTYSQFLFFIFFFSFCSYNKNCSTQHSCVVHECCCLNLYESGQKKMCVEVGGGWCALQAVRAIYILPICLETAIVV